MDSTHIVFHPNDKGIFVSNFEQDNFLGKMFKKKMLKRVVKKTAAKHAKMSGGDAKTIESQLNKTLNAGIKKAGIDKKLKAMDIATYGMLAAGATAGAMAAAPALFGAKGVAAAGAAKAGTAATAAKSAGAIGAAGTAVKKVAAKKPSAIMTAVKTLDPKKVTAELVNTKAGQTVTEIANRLPEPVKEALRNEGEKMLNKLRNDRTAPETLPKTRTQTQLEASVQTGGAGLGGLQLNNPLVIAGLVLLVIAVIVSITRK